MGQLPGKLEKLEEQTAILTQGHGESLRLLTGEFDSTRLQSRFESGIDLPVNPKTEFVAAVPGSGLVVCRRTRSGTTPISENSGLARPVTENFAHTAGYSATTTPTANTRRR